MASQSHLPEDRYFGPDLRQKEIAQRLYRPGREAAVDLPHTATWIRGCSPTRTIRWARPRTC